MTTPTLRELRELRELCEVCEARPATCINEGALSIRCCDECCDEGDGPHAPFMGTQCRPLTEHDRPPRRGGT